MQYVLKKKKDFQLLIYAREVYDKVLKMVDGRVREVESEESKGGAG